MTPLLQIENLRVSVGLDGGQRDVLRGVSLGVSSGESVAVVGESGSGKSMMARAVLRLLPPMARATGSVRFQGENILELGSSKLRALRAERIGMIFQDPRAHINPVRSVGDFLTEGLITMLGLNRRAAERRVAAILSEVGISRPEARMRQYPHELSGGLLQRVMIAAVLAVGPDLILADEPTTALDVTTQSEVMAILVERRQAQGMALLLITHDLDLATAVSDRTVVMYAGRIMEQAKSSAIHIAPLHPYTAALSASRPSPAGAGGSRELHVIPGRPLSAIEAPHGCPFVPRCRFAQPACEAREPVLREFDNGASSCRRTEEVHADLVAPGQTGADG